MAQPTNDGAGNSKMVSADTQDHGTRFNINSGSVYYKSIIQAGGDINFSDGPRLDPWTVPRGVNRLFVGREGIGEKLAEAFKSDDEGDASDQPKCFVISGLGGTGKSEVAIKFAVDHRREYWGVFWIDCGPEGTAEESFKRIGKLCGIESPDVSSVKDYLSSTKERWLLIIDNADDYTTVYSSFMPPRGRGNVIITTRNPEFKAKYATVGSEALDQLDLDGARELLLRAAAIPETNWTSKKEAATSIVQELGRHTLAVLHAGSFIDGNCELEDYLGLYHKQRSRLFNSERSQEHSTYGTVHATFEVSVAKMEALSRENADNALAAKDALDVLGLLAFMHYEGTIDLILNAATLYASTVADKESPPASLYLYNFHAAQLPPCCPNERLGPHGTLRWRQACKMLRSFSLITIGKNNTGIATLTMHPLVHAWSKDKQNATLQSKAWLASSSTLALSCQDSSYYIPIFEHTQKHVRACLSHDISKFAECIQHPGLISILWRLANVQFMMYEDLNMGQVLILLVKELERSEREFKKRSTVSRKVRYRLQRAFSKKSPRKEDILPYELAYLSVYHLRGSWLASQGDISEAIRQLEHVVTKREKLLPEDSHNRLLSQSELASAYMVDGQILTAIELLEHVLDVRKKKFDEGHPDRLAAEHELARAYLVNKQIPAAIELIKHVVDVQKKLDEGHPDRLASEHELARAYLENKQNPAAIELLEHVVDMKKKKLDEGHPDRLTSQEVLAGAYYENGQIAEALALFEYVVAVGKKTLPEHHPGRLITLKWLKKCYDITGQIEKANKIREEIRQAERLKKERAP